MTRIKNVKNVFLHLWFRLRREEAFVSSPRHVFYFILRYPVKPSTSVNRFVSDSRAFSLEQYPGALPCNICCGSYCTWINVCASFYALASAGYACAVEAIVLSLRSVVLMSVPCQHGLVRRAGESIAHMQQRRHRKSAHDFKILRFVGRTFTFFAVFTHSSLVWTLATGFLWDLGYEGKCQTRSIAVTERPRDASCHWIFSLSYSRSLKVIWNDTLEQGVSIYQYQYFTVTILYRFWDIQHLIMAWPWNLGLGSFKVIDNGSVR